MVADPPGSSPLYSGSVTMTRPIAHTTRHSTKFTVATTTSSSPYPTVPQVWRPVRVARRGTSSQR